jgi:hypothetical protein
MKKHYCIDCHTLISRKPNAKRCKKCYGKTIVGNNNVSKRKDVRIKISKKLKGLKRTNKTKLLLSKAMKKRFKNPKNHPSWKGGLPNCLVCGKKVTQYNAQRCGKCSRIHNMKTMMQRGSKIYNGCLFKSSWEVIYAQWLDEHHIYWTYESYSFDLGNTTYTPDFYLPETDTFIEVKGYWRPDAIKKFRLFKRKFKNIKINIIGKKEINNIKLAFAALKK